MIYQRSSNDSNVDVVVLKSDEDKVALRPGGGKMTYVVLRRDPNATPAGYYPIYAYVKDVGSSGEEDGDESINNDGVVTLSDGRQVLVEWDVWEDRRKKRPVIWTSCEATLFVSCGFNASAFPEEEGEEIMWAKVIIIFLVVFFKNT